MLFNINIVVTMVTIVYRSYFSENCADIYLSSSDSTPYHTVRVHFALLLAEVS